MNENINLCRILKGLEGNIFYSPLYGNMVLNSVYTDEFTADYETINKNIHTVSFNKNGKISNEFDSECLFLPSKKQRDWNKFERPIPLSTPMMVSYDRNDWMLRFYSGVNKGKHTCYKTPFTSINNTKKEIYKYIIPFKHFNPECIEESIQYDIQV